MKVVISWSSHQRMYTIGVKQFLAALNVEKTEEEITAAARWLLEQEEAKPHVPKK